MANRLAAAVLLLSVTAAKAQTIPDMISEAARKANVPVFLAHELIERESQFNPQAYSRGAIGLGQIKCITAKEMGFKGNCQELFKPAINLIYSMKYFSRALAKANGDECKAKNLYKKGFFHKNTDCNNKPKPAKVKR